MAEQLLYGADILTGLEEMGREAMAEGVATGGLEDAGVTDGAADGALQGALRGVVPADDAGSGVGGPSSGREEVLPAELTVGLGVLLRQGMGEEDAAMAVIEVLLMEDADVIDLATQGVFQGPGQQGGAILLPLAVADDDVPLAEVERP